MTSAVRDSDYVALVSLLDGWAESAKLHGDEVVVTLPGGRVVTLALTPDDLDMMRVAFGLVPHVFEYLTERLTTMPEHCDFLVYTLYDVEPATHR